MRGRVYRNAYSLGFVLILLVLSGVTFKLYTGTSVDLRTFIGSQKISLQHPFYKKVNSIQTPNASTASHMNDTTCSFYPLFTKEAQEVDLLLDLIAWPETPPVTSNLSLESTSDPAHSSFTILPQKGEGTWHVGDELEVLIRMCDFHGQPKKTGGDVIIARLFDSTLLAGVTGQVLDHRNGSYSAVFSLLWEGSAQVEVTLIHPSEAVTVLQKLNVEQPDRVYFKSLFRSGEVTETTTCNVCLKTTQQGLCNFTNHYTGDQWFCYKPKELDCDVRVNDFKGGINYKLKPIENKLLQSGVNMKVSIPALGRANITVLPKRKDHLGENNKTVKTGRPGYYYQDVWRGLDGNIVHQFNDSKAVSQCLKGKVVHLYGDSTIRQWFEHFVQSLPDLKEFNLRNSRQTGPLMALDYANNILITFRVHGPPLRSFGVPISELRYIANELDSVVGGPNTAVVFGIWAHFGTFPVEVYIRRLLSIRTAVVRLLARAPGTLVVIRTGNPKALTVLESVVNSDWYSLQCDKVLRAIFKGVNVRLVDAWEMVIAHHLPHNLHPKPPIIKNMINVILSYICPSAGSH